MKHLNTVFLFVNSLYTAVFPTMHFCLQQWHFKTSGKSTSLSLSVSLSLSLSLSEQVKITNNLRAEYGLVFPFYNQSQFKLIYPTTVYSHRQKLIGV